ncbi:MAG: hypothetical protein FWF44_02010 [Defluviitaleaceae bacterium]|nr:hypothetical protein [Defluviitaleaceae bacterium]
MIFYNAIAMPGTFLGIFADTCTGETAVIFNDAQALLDYYEKNRREIWAGYGKSGLLALKSALCLDSCDIKIFSYDMAGAGRPPNLEMQKYDVIRLINDRANQLGSNENAMESLPQSLLSVLKRGLAAEIGFFISNREAYSAKLNLLNRFALPLDYIGASKPAIYAARLLKILKRQPPRPSYNAVR